MRIALHVAHRVREPRWRELALVLGREFEPAVVAVAVPALAAEAVAAAAALMVPTSSG